MRISRSVLCLWMLCIASLQIVSQPELNQGLTSQDVVDLAARSVDFTLSPNGNWVIYSSSSAYDAFSGGSRSEESWLYDISGHISLREVPVRSSAVCWAPDSRSFAFAYSNQKGSESSPGSARIEIREISIDDLTWKTLVSSADLAKGFNGLETVSIRQLKWSPDGKSIAFVANGRATKNTKAEVPADSTEAGREPWRAKEMHVEPYGGIPGAPSSRDFLFTVDINSGTVRRLTGDSLVLGLNFDWSPDSSRVVFDAQAIEDYRGSNLVHSNSNPSNLYTVERGSGTISTLFRRRGYQSADAVWSPNGEWIVFSLAPLGGNAPDARLALVKPTGGEPRLLTKSDISVGRPKMFWSPDGKYIYFGMASEMKTPLFRVPVGGGDLEKITPDYVLHSKVTPSANGKLLAFVTSSTTTPRELCVSSWSFADIRKLTDAKELKKDNLKAISRVKVETLKWRSADKRWDIHGVLLKPPGYEKGRKYPLIVAIRGGPGMVDLQTFGLDRNVPALQLALRGYLVLSPNTRGRGGYGVDFENALAADGTWTLTAVGDVMSGVEMLINLGIADPERLGVGGHSYGAHLASMIITKTNRFKAAWLGDPVAAERLSYAISWGLGDAESRAEYQKWYGSNSPPTTADFRRIFEDSPIFSVQDVRTPTLLHCGENSPGMQRLKNERAGGCWVFFHGLQANNVTSELKLWPKSGHGSFTPMGQAETLDDEIEWFDYWVRGIATERMAKRYGPPKNAENTAGTATNAPKAANNGKRP